MHTWKKKKCIRSWCCQYGWCRGWDLLNGDLRDVVGATASRRNERRRRDLARIRVWTEQRPTFTWFGMAFRTSEFIRFFVRRIRWGSNYRPTWMNDSHKGQFKESMEG
jgi:hypothetical protein